MPPARYGWWQAAILHYFRTESSDGRTWRERPLSGIAYPTAWSWEYGRELPLEPQYQQVQIVAGIGTITPTFFNIGNPTAQRVTIDYCIGGESVRTYLPVTFTGVEPMWSDVLGVLIGGNGGTIRAAMEGRAPQDLPVTQGGFGGRVAGGELSVISRLVLTCTSGSRVITRRVNTGYDTCAVLFPVDGGEPHRLSRTVPAGLRMLSVPGVPLRFDPVGDLGLPASQLSLARWNPALATASKYESFPLAPPFRPGRGFWLKLPFDRTLQVDAVAPDSTAPVLISAPAGWNQIASPWQESLSIAALRVKYQEREIVSFASAVTKGWIGAKAWRWSPGVGYQVADTLDAWDAAWIRVNVPDGVTLIVPPLTAQSASLAATASREPRAASGSSWRLRLVAAADGGVSEVTVGAGAGATSGFDPGLDEERPPSVGEPLPIHMRIAPTLRGWSRTTSLELDTDIRAPGRRSEQWMLETRTARPRVAVTLTVSAEGPVPRGLRLRDLTTGRRYPLAPGTLTLGTGSDGAARWVIER
jgi:hypothetical protein